MIIDPENFAEENDPQFHPPLINFNTGEVYYTSAAIPEQTKHDILVSGFANPPRQYFFVDWKFTNGDNHGN